MGGGCQELELPFTDMLTGERFSGEAAVEDHQLITSWKSETGSNVVEKSGRIAISIVFKFAVVSRRQHVKV